MLTILSNPALLSFVTSLKASAREPQRMLQAKHHAVDRQHFLRRLFFAHLENEGPAAKAAYAARRRALMEPQHTHHSSSAMGLQGRALGDAERDRRQVP